VKKYGFQQMDDPWLDVLIFNLYLFYIITFITAAKKTMKKKSITFL
jgi:hypothetical protein